MYRPDLEPKRPFDRLVLRAPPNWTAVCFFALLGGLHLSIAIFTFFTGHWEAYLSLVLGTLFLSVSAISTRCRFEMALLGEQQKVRLRTGWGRFCFERSIPFSRIGGVRLTIGPERRPQEWCIELLSPYEDIQCPPTRIPRQQALFLALLLDVPLVKVSDEVFTPSALDSAERLHSEESETR